jgi:hypothetical protein
MRAVAAAAVVTAALRARRSAGARRLHLQVRGGVGSRLPPYCSPIARRPVHAGRIVTLSMDRVAFPNGEEGELEFIRHRGAAAVLAFVDPPSDPDPRIVLVHQFRYAAGGDLYEVPAGMPDTTR